MLWAEHGRHMIKDSIYQHEEIENQRHKCFSFLSAFETSSIQTCDKDFSYPITTFTLTAAYIQSMTRRKEKQTVYYLSTHLSRQQCSLCLALMERISSFTHSHRMTYGNRIDRQQQISLNGTSTAFPSALRWKKRQLYWNEWLSIQLSVALLLHIRVRVN